MGTTKDALIRFSLLLAVTVLLGLPGKGIAAVTTVGPTTLTRDTTWSGDVLVTGDVHVPEGITLTVAPGTRVKFRKLGENSDRNLFGTDSPYYEQAEVIVTGRLIARGTAKKPIIFTSAEAKPQPGDWSALNFLGGKGNVVEHCLIDYAYNGVHGHGAEILIRNNVFRKCAVAISVKREDDAKGTPGFGISADITVANNLIEDNKGGVNVRISKAVITDNTIRNNKFFGIWIKGACPGEISRNEISGNQKGIFFFKADKIAIANNNIHGNTDYNLAIADEQQKDVQAGGNWLGTTDPAAAGELVFDGKADPAVARIVIEPLLPVPVKNAGRKP